MLWSRLVCRFFCFSFYLFLYLKNLWGLPERDWSFGGVREIKMSCNIRKYWVDEMGVFSDVNWLRVFFFFSLRDQGMGDKGFIECTCGLEDKMSSEISRLLHRCDSRFLIPGSESSLDVAGRVSRCDRSSPTRKCLSGIKYLHACTLLPQSQSRCYLFIRNLHDPMQPD